MRNDVGTEDLPGEDWRSKAEAKGERHTEDPVAIALERARERGRGREACAPETIPPLGWRDILWRVLKGIIEDRILYTSGGVAFFTLLAFFPAVATIVSIYGLVTDVNTLREHCSDGVSKPAVKLTLQAHELVIHLTQPPNHRLRLVRRVELFEQQSGGLGLINGLEHSRFDADDVGDDVVEHADGLRC